jgi:hypothetical protein
VVVHSGQPQVDIDLGEIAADIGPAADIVAQSRLARIPRQR